MRVIVRNPMSVLFVVGAALGTVWPQSASYEMSLSELRSQQPQEVIFGSAPCRRAREAPRRIADDRGAVHRESLVSNLSALMEKSDEVILAAALDRRSTAIGLFRGFGV